VFTGVEKAFLVQGSQRKILQLPIICCQGANYYQHLDKVLVKNVRFEVFTAVTMENVVFWDIKPSSYLTGETLRLHYRVQPVNAM
jgi:hypothetical protein